MLFRTEQLARTDNEITLVNIKFSLNACKHLSENEVDNLSDIARDFFYFVQSFGNQLKLTDFLNLWVVEDRIQDLDSITCGICQIYFYNNLFSPNENSKIQNKAKLNKKTIQIFFNKLFTLDDQQQNEKIITDYAKNNDIRIT